MRQIAVSSLPFRRYSDAALLRRARTGHLFMRLVTEFPHIALEIMREMVRPLERTPTLLRKAQSGE